VLTTAKTYGVPMIVKAVKMAPRFVVNLTFAVVLCLAVVLVIGVSVLGLTVALQGWVTNPSTTIHAPTAR
jgi:hypothetical protein